MKIRFFLTPIVLTFITITQVGLGYAQEPRYFEEGFQDNYSWRSYNYEGREIEGITQTESGEAAKFDPNNKETPNYEEKENPGLDTSFSMSFLSWILIFVLVLAVLYLVYILMNEGGRSSFFSKKKKIKVSAIEGEIAVEDLENTDIQSLIQQAEKEGNYRLAIRLYNLLVLQTLSLKSLIQLEEDKTNEEYYREIAQKDFGKAFAYTSYLYSYVWYGKFNLDSGQYNKAKINFVELINKVA